jgi:hypothetical protein
MEQLVIGLIAGGIIGFFFGFKAGQMSVIRKFRQRPGLDGQDPE